ncbi:MAG TPA: RNA pseudouridine synthase [Bacteroidales bacterium]|nr:RNA pseudouridine synthase [Bacteroidales bacterium]
MKRKNEYIDNNELFEHHRIETDAGQKPLRIDKFLVNRLDNTSRSRIQNAALAGNIIVNDIPVKPNYKVKPHDIIQILLAYPPREKEITPENIPLNIIYEDESVLIVNKEAGMVVHPGVGNYTGTLVNALMYHLQDIPLFKTGEQRPGLVHRIDKNTSGLLVIAKSEYALNNLGRQFYEHSTGRRYTAIVWGNPGDEGTITGNIGRNPRHRRLMYVFPDGDEGKPAVTHYRLLENLSYVSLIECELETGRTHQIRVHMSYIKHPLFNDPDYGGDKILRGTTFSKYQQFIRNCFSILPRQALHARYLSFNHPDSGKRMEFESDLPEEMNRVIEKWRNYVSGREEL